MDSLCSSCEEFFRKSRRRSGRIAVSFQSWSRNALTSSCHLCTILFHAAAGQDHKKFISDYSCAKYEILSQTTRFIDTNEGNYKYLAVVEQPGHDSQRIQHRKQLEKRIGGSTWTAETIQQVLEWMTKCSETHENCQQYREAVGPPSALPLRLVDVDPHEEYLTGDLWRSDIGLLSCDKAPNICIRFSKDIMASKSMDRAQYLTLSHRWGDHNTLRLTDENMATFSQQVPVSSLSSCFRHAIQITRCLGFRYIWIDAICINQVDATEKAAEISRMQEIYAHSHLNLSATSAKDDSMGLIFERNPLSVIPILKVAGSRKNSSTKAGTSTERVLMISGGPWETFVDLGPINQRGWVLQERLLAPRVLHFCYNMVYWECPSLKASEVDPQGQVNHDDVTNKVDYRTNIKRDFAMASIKGKAVGGRPDLHEPPLEPFFCIIRAYYFPMQLTYGQDRLAAISGVSRWFMSRMGFAPEDYVAGFWRESLPEQLLWHLFKGPMKGTIRDAEAAPSWTWASVFSDSLERNSLAFGVSGMSQPKPLIQGLHAAIVPSDGDLFARPRTASLSFHTSLIPVYHDLRKDDPHMRLSGDKKWYKESQDPWPFRQKLSFVESLQWYVHILRLKLSREPPERRFEWRPTKMFIQVRWDSSDMLRADAPSSPPQKLYLVPVLCEWEQSLPAKEGEVPSGVVAGNASPQNPAVRGLLLRKMPGKGQYARVGFFMTNNYQSPDNSEVELALKILSRIPKPAIEKMISSDTMRPASDSKVSDISRNTEISTEDYLSVNDDGMYLIEVL